MASRWLSCEQEVMTRQPEDDPGHGGWQYTGKPDGNPAHHAHPHAKSAIKAYTT